jgi:hypothetical protein
MNLITESVIFRLECLWYKKTPSDIHKHKKTYFIYITVPMPKPHDMNVQKNGELLTSAKSEY